MALMELHDLCKAFPRSDGKAFDAFKRDIEDNGLLVPITTYQGKILDGQNRYKACIDLGIEPHYVEYHGDSPAHYVASLNAQRRDLNKSQRAVIALELVPGFEAEGSKWQQEAGIEAGKLPTNPARRAESKLEDARPQASDASDKRAPQATDHAAEALGVSGRFVRRAKRVQQHRPELLERIKAGMLTVTAAEKIVTGRREVLKAEIKTERQRQLAAKAKGRVEKLIAQFEGTQLGLKDFPLDRALALASEEDVEWWVSTITGTIKSLNGLRKQLKGV